MLSQQEEQTAPVPVLISTTETTTAAATVAASVLRSTTTTTTTSTSTTTTIDDKTAPHAAEAATEAEAVMGCNRTAEGISDASVSAKDGDTTTDSAANEMTADDNLPAAGEERRSRYLINENQAQDLLDRVTSLITELLSKMPAASAVNAAQHEFKGLMIDFSTLTLTMLHTLDTIDRLEEAVAATEERTSTLRTKKHSFGLDEDGDEDDEDDDTKTMTTVSVSSDWTASPAADAPSVAAGSEESSLHLASVLSENVHLRTQTQFLEIEVKTLDTRITQLQSDATMLAAKVAQENAAAAARLRETQSALEKAQMREHELVREHECARKAWRESESALAIELGNERALEASRVKLYETRRAELVEENKNDRAELVKLHEKKCAALHKELEDREAKATTLTQKITKLETQNAEYKKAFSTIDSDSVDAASTVVIADCSIDVDTVLKALNFIRKEIIVAYLVTLKPGSAGAADLGARKSMIKIKCKTETAAGCIQHMIGWWPEYRTCKTTVVTAAGKHLHYQFQRLAS
ncbi:uncharacterized protein V1518DRAFT_421656 [Limtongia smithiae]|uniref:uncharacterized protein n=1 Tax=Limtongia smithiae TaxID=1125753 RepID=UPI0034CFA161